MAAAVRDIGTLITRTPKIRRGRPHIAGTGVTVRRIAVWRKLGLSPEEIVDNFGGHLTLAQVHAALAYYYANREEIEADLAADEAEADRLEREHYLQRQVNGVSQRLELTGRYALNRGQVAHLSMSACSALDFLPRFLGGGQRSGGTG